MAGPNIDFWEERYRTRQMAWDRGAPSPQLAAWLDAGHLRAGARIAVPGCGAGWEVAELARLGFVVTGIDYAPAAIGRARDLLVEQGLSAEVIEADVLAWRPAQPFAAIYEQTCLCALHPDRWVRYGQALHDWLEPEGRLFALFLQAPRAESADGSVVGPPYHCDINGMRAVFPATHWHWPKPPYRTVPHPSGWHELAVCLEAA